jgi:type 1 glutamine amidotransferase
MRAVKSRASLLAVAAAALCTTVFAQQAPPAGTPPAGTPAGAGPAGAQTAGTPAGGAPQGRGRGQGPVIPDVPPLKVYLYGGPKTHAEGEHDYPQFIADWSKILQNRGAIVDGGLHFPSARELAGVDVLVIYKGDAGYVGLEDRANLDQYLRRGGGIISLHDGLCSDDTAYFANIVGGAKRHGEVNYTLEANVPYTIVDTAHPIMQGMSDFKITDEAFFLMTWSKTPEIKVLATAVIDATPSAGTHKGEVVPQIWTYEKSLAPAPTGSPYRAFVWMQGHNYSNFALPNVQQMLLRAIAWTGKRPVDTLMTERPQRGSRGNRGTMPAGAPGTGRGGE